MIDRRHEEDSVRLTHPESGVDALKDIFISYSRDDLPWVRDYLTRLLNAAGLRYAIDEEDFEIGRDLTESIKATMRGCRYTLLVMTPHWVDGRWTHYEKELALEREKQEGKVQVLAIKLRECNVPGNLQAKLYLDLSRARTRDADVVRLLRQLEVPEENIERACQAVARKTRHFLAELLQESDASAIIRDVGILLTEVRASNEDLECTKELHDRLQQIQFPQQQVARLLGELGPADAEVPWYSIQPAAFALIEKLTSLRDYIQAQAAAGPDVAFVTPLLVSCDKLMDALRDRDAYSFQAFAGSIASQVEIGLPRLNDRIVQLVCKRPMDDVIANLDRIYDLVADIEFDDAAGELLELFREKVRELVALERQIRTRVEAHSVLQNAEVYLNLCHPDDNPTSSDISRHWGTIEISLQELDPKGPGDRLREHMRMLSSQLSDATTVRDDRFEDAVRMTFSMLAHEMRNVFNRVDIDLRADCNQLGPRNDELEMLLLQLRREEAVQN